MQVILSFALLAFMIFALVDVITHDESQIKNLGKLPWAIIIILLPLIGSILWFALGRQYGREYDGPVDRGGFGDPRRHDASGNALPIGVPSGRQGAAASAMSPEDEAAAIEREIAYHEKQAQIRRLEADLKARREERPGS